MIEITQGMLELAKSSPKLLELIYTDLAQPSVQKVGTALSTVLDLSNTLLIPIKLVNDKARLNFKKHMDSYEKKLFDVDDDKVMDVPAEIGLPILDKLTYTTNDNIAELFTNLLHKASSTDTIHLAHPSFVNLIERLSVDEAKLVNYLVSRRDIPCVSIRGYLKGKNGFHTYRKNETGLSTKVKLDFPQNLGLYIENFVSMGVLTPANGEHKIHSEYYNDVLSQLEQLKNQLEQARDIERVEVVKSFYEVSGYGLQFMRACTKK